MNTQCFLVTLLFVFYSCNTEKNQNNIKLEPISDTVFYSCKSDTTNSLIELRKGNDTILSLGRIKVKSKVYNISSIVRNILVADGYKNKYYLVLNDGYDEYYYETSTKSNLPKCIEDNYLIFNSSCREKIQKITPDLICFKCLKNECFLREFEPESGIPPQE